MLKLLAALAVLAGKADDMSRQDARRIARQYGFARGGSGGGIRKKLNLRGLPAFNEHRVYTGETWADGRPVVDVDATRANRNAAKARRRALRARAA